MSFGDGKKLSLLQTWSHPAWKWQAYKLIPLAQFRVWEIEKSLWKGSGTERERSLTLEICAEDRDKVSFQLKVNKLFI